MTRTPRTPSLRLHKPSGRAVVTIDGQDHYVGEYGSTAAQAAYDRLIVEWISNGRRMPTRNDVTVNELMLAYLRRAEIYYVKDGRPTSELHVVKAAMRHLNPDLSYTSRE